MLQAYKAKTENIDTSRHLTPYLSQKSKLNIMKNTWHNACQKVASYSHDQFSIWGNRCDDTQTVVHWQRATWDSRQFIFYHAVKHNSCHL